MRSGLAVLVLVGCGRMGFDAPAEPPPDLDELMFVEVGRAQGLFDGFPFVTSDGDTLYFGNASNQLLPQWFATYSEKTGVVDRSGPESPLCACGYLGTFLGGGDYLYYFANEGSRMRRADFTWSSIDGYEPVGESAQSIVKGRLHLVGGRDSMLDHRAYDLATGTFDMLRPPPEPIRDACGGTYDDELYVLDRDRSWRFDGDRWTISDPPPRGAACSRRHALQWRGRLAFTTSGELHVFHPPSGHWNAPLQLPHADGAIAVTADDTLYFLADDTSDVVLYRVEP